MTAAAIAEQCSGWVAAMVKPRIAERRVKGALYDVARETGVSHAKIYRLWHRQTNCVQAWERESIRAALSRFAASQLERAERDIERYQKLVNEREALEKQFPLDL